LKTCRHTKFKKKSSFYLGINFDVVMPSNRQLAKDTLSNPRSRIGTRKRVAKVLADYVDTSFSESEPPLLHNIPMPANPKTCKRGNPTRGKPPKSSTKSNKGETTQEFCHSAAKRFILIINRY
jgi:hypothetical protein